MAEIYHERQILHFCLLHSLNNLFQEKGSFTRANLNTIAEKLASDDPSRESRRPFSGISNSHHNSITGNYDINVLIVALDSRGKSVIWHDRRNGASTIDFEASEDTLMGFIVNVPVRRDGGLRKSRHWVTLRKIDRIWYNLDSVFEGPYPFKDVQEITEFLDGVISVGGQVLMVTNGRNE